MRELVNGELPVIKNKYRHMMPNDAEIWTDFLGDNDFDFEKVWYDLRVGNDLRLAPDADELTKRIALATNRKRIDAVCLLASEIWVVEVKPRAIMSTIGQVVSYVRLFLNEFMVALPVIPVIVCGGYDKDLVDEFVEFGIKVIVVG